LANGLSAKYGAVRCSATPSSLGRKGTTPVSSNGPASEQNANHPGPS
jgi:hypothetical protein